MGRKRENTGKPNNSAEYSSIVEEIIRYTDYYSAKYSQSQKDYDRVLIENKSLSDTLLQREEDIIKLNNLLKYNEKTAQDSAKIKESETTVLAEYVWELINTVDHLHTELDIMRKLNGKQKIQISYLNAQTERYQRTINSVTAKWYGKAALKVYHLIKK